MKNSGLLQSSEYQGIEIKISQSIQKLIEPYVHNFYKNQALLTDMNLKYQAKVAEVDKLFLNFQPLYTQLKDKISFIEQKLENQIIQEITQDSKNKFAINSFQNQLDTMQNSIMSFEQNDANNNSKIKNLELSCNAFKQDIQRIIDFQNSNQNVIFNELKQKMFELEQSERKFSLRLSNFESTYLEDKNRQNQQSQKTQNLVKELDQSKNLKVLKSNIQVLQQEIDDQKKNQLKIDQLQNKTNEIESFLTHNIQYHIQNQINESLFISLPVKQFYKYAQFEKQKYDILSQDIVSSQQMKSLIKFIEEEEIILLNAAKRYQKITETVKKADENQSDEENENKNVENQKAQINKSNKNDNLKNSTSDETNSVATKVQNGLVYFEQQLQSLKDYCDQRFLDQNLNFITFDQRINKLLEECYTQQILFHAEVDKKMSETFHQQKKKIQTLEKLQNEQNSQFGISQINEQIIKLRNTQNQFQDLCKHFLAILQQDEYDKQGIRLQGSKDVSFDDSIISKNGKQSSMKKSSISIDHDCLTCSGQPINLIKYFKAACLNYTSSDINIDGQIYKRDEIFNKCLQILNQSNEQRQPKNIKLQKIYQKKRSVSIQESPRFFTTEKGKKLQNLSEYKIFI